MRSILARASTLLQRCTRPALAAAAALSLAACDLASLPGTGGGGSGSVQVALLVPQGAADADVARIGRDLTAAAQLAVADAGETGVDLRVYNTAGDAARAGQLAERAVAEGADIVIGPLYAGAANAAGAAVADTGTSVISFSNTTAIAGGNVFVAGFTFEDAAARLLDYAGRNGRSRAYIANAADLAERTGRDAIIAAAQRSRVDVVGNLEFPLSQEGVNNAAPQIAAALDETDADLLFLTSTIEGALPFLARRLTAVGVTPETVQKAGLSRWDSLAAALGEPGLQSGWFTRPDTAAAGAFNQRFADAYGRAPHPVAGLGYDGVATAVALARRGRGFGPSNVASLNQINGASGIFQFLQDGTNRRALAVATIQNRQVVVLDAAPSSFGRFGL